MNMNLEVEEQYWEDLEERERRIASMRDLARRSAPPTTREEPRTLLKALEVQAFASLEDVRQLAETRYEAPVISLYLSLAPDGGGPKAFLTRFKSLKKRALEASAGFIDSLDRQKREGLLEDLDELQAFLETHLHPEGYRSLVLFKSRDTLNRMIKLRTRTRDTLSIGFDAYTLPLEQILEEYEKILVAYVTKERTDLFTYHMGLQQDLGTLRSFIPSGKRGLQPQVQRHRLTHLQWHLKNTATLISKNLQKYRCEHLILFGDKPVLEQLKGFFDEPTRRSLICNFSEVPHTDQAKINELIEQCIQETRKQQEATILEHLSSYRAQNMLVEGIENVIAAMNNFLVRQLYIDIELQQTGFICRNHHYLSLTKEICPFCSQELLQVDNIIDELIEIARLQHIQLMLIEYRRDLINPSRGIAAVLYSLTTT
jgi:hypothetical protein